MKCKLHLSIHLSALLLSGLLGVSSTASAEAPKTAAPSADHLQAGFSYLQKLQPDRAIACFTPLLIHAGAKGLKDKANAQRMSRYFILIGRAFLFDENLPAAVQAFESARLLDPESEFALAYSAENLSRSGRYEEAKPLYKMLEQKKPLTLLCARALAQEDFRGGEFAQAKARLKSVASLKETAEDWKWHAMMGSILSREGDTAGGAVEYKTAVKLCDDPYQVKMVQSMAAAWQLRPALQETLMREAAKLQPDDGLWRTNLAAALLAQPNKGKPAFALFSEAVHARRFTSKAFYNFGIDLNLEKKQQQALQCADYLRKLAPWNDTLYRLEGQIYLSKNDTARVDQCYAQMLRLHPHLAVAYATYGDFCQAYNLKDRLQSVLQQFVKELPGCAYGWRRLGDMQIAQGKWDDAKISFAKALALVPPGEPITSPLAQDEYSRCHAGLGSCYYRAGDRARAQQEAIAFNQLKFVPDLPALLKLVVVRPNRIALSGITTKDRQVADYVMMADMLYQTHDYEDSIKEYKKAIELSPDDTDLHGYLYTVYNDSGNLVAAVQEDFQLSQKLVGKVPHAVGKMFEKKQAPQPKAAGNASTSSATPQAQSSDGGASNAEKR